ncbi:MAG: TRAP transporter large permease [Clostridia bacterium]|jgi:tripartite ATP-independent transporter DctM subunit|nr:TRAP transporter large permease [Clostridia bacterium]MDH7573702.1 TRAP transporter large permease [Clostridia bacterium]
MSPEIIGAIGLAILLVLVFLRVWVGFAMAAVGFLGLLYFNGWGKAVSVLTTEPHGQVASLTFVTVPLFILMGALVSNTGLAKDLYEAACRWIGGVRGGLAAATVAACAFFAAVSGSSMATAATLGKVAYPEMRRYKYNDRLAAGACAAGGTIGILIPPSLGFIVYGLITQQSIGRLFLAGIIPGILQAIFYMVTITLLCRRNPALGPAVPEMARVSFTRKLSAMGLAGPVLLIFVVTIGGIYLGVFTPTEAGAIGALASLVVGLAARRLGWREFRGAAMETAQATAMIVAMLVGAFIFARFLAVSKLPIMLSEVLQTSHLGTGGFLAFVIVLCLILGCFFDVNAAIMLTLPIIYPSVVALGIDPIWFGVLVVRLNEIGLITPPIGMNCFVISGSLGVPTSTVFRGIWPFLIADAFHVALLIAVPELSLYLAR